MRNRSDTPRALFSLLLAMVSFAPSAYSADVPTSAGETAATGASALPWDSPARQAALRVQLFLDAEGFGPGKIDGRWGEFSRKAADRWNATARSAKVAVLDDGELDGGKAGDLPWTGEMLVTYEVTGEDLESIGELATGPEAMARQKELPYGSLMEMVAEKFHADPDYLREVNSLAPDARLEVGTKLKVPNVAIPFLIAEPKEMARKAAESSEAVADADKPADGEDKSDDGRELTVLREQQVVEVRQRGELVHSFPVSPGANDNRSPAGEWKVESVTWMPEFRWDQSMLEKGTRSNDAHLLPPGPNNPVGIVWIGLTADGIGLHGTPSPAEIGRNRSHGCIRLSNWDALRLGKLVSPGTPVEVK